MLRPDQDTLDALKEKNGEIYGVTIKLEVGGEAEEYYFIHKRVSKGEWQRFQAAIADESQRPYAYENLVTSCTVWPSPKDVEDTLKQRPGLAQSYGRQISRTAGIAESAESKKL